MSHSSQCIECEHYRLELKCAAFPNGVPGMILTGEHDHRAPFPGDKGIRFEPVKRKPERE